MTSLPRAEGRHRIVVPRLWGWCPWGATYASKQAALDALAQFGPADGKVVPA
jgi:hypothetical protein